jgi:flagellar basal-body rod modification protein FlgD
MLAQTTQLASMEQLTTLTGLTDESFSLQMRAAASALLGQTVEYYGDDDEVLSGTVTSVSFAQKVPTVTIGDRTIRLDELLGARAA